MIETDIKLIVQLLQDVVRNTGGAAPMQVEIPNEIPDASTGGFVPTTQTIPTTAQQVAKTFAGTELPEATTKFEVIIELLKTMDKDSANTWYQQCYDLGVSDKQKAAITKIFKKHLS